MGLGPASESPAGLIERQTSESVLAEEGWILHRNMFPRLENVAGGHTGRTTDTVLGTKEGGEWWEWP